MTKTTHFWEDVSFHGSPVYECKYCCKSRGYKNLHDKEHCEETYLALKKEKEEIERKERLEYERIIYLLEKYGNKDD